MARPWPAELAGPARSVTIASILFHWNPGRASELLQKRASLSTWDGTQELPVGSPRPGGGSNVFDNHGSEGTPDPDAAGDPRTVTCGTQDTTGKPRSVRCRRPLFGVVQGHRTLQTPSSSNQCENRTSSNASLVSQHAPMSGNATRDMPAIADAGVVHGSHSQARPPAPLSSRARH